MQALFVAVAIVAGLILGFIVRSVSARRESALLEQRNRESLDALTALQLQLSNVQSESATRAGYEPLAVERANTITQLHNEISQVRADLEYKTSNESNLHARISQLEAELKNERANAPERAALVDEAKEALTNQFKLLASDILEEKRKHLAEANKNELQPLLVPLREQLTEFRARVDTVQTESTVGVTELKTLIGTLGNLNQALTEEAHNLATALRRDTRAQGNWGETILRNILDKSGLQEGIHYSYQQSFWELVEEGTLGQRRQTDVVVNLPGGRHLVIDSKVSLNAYNDSVNASNEATRSTATKKHIANVKEHIAELSGRNYQNLYGVQSPDFVVMFLPIEPAFMLAVQEDDNIWLHAYERNILLAGPTNILFVLRIVESLWRQEQQVRSVAEVMEQAGRLYVRFAGFVNDMDAVGKSLDNAQLCFGEAKKKVSENLIKQAERLRDFGVKPKFPKKGKPIPANWLPDEADEEDLMIAASGTEVSEDPMGAAADREEFVTTESELPEEHQLG